MDRIIAPSEIPSYSLYGEVGYLPDVLHHEAIRTRAALHDWTIGPHRHSRLHQVFLIRDRKGEATVDGANIGFFGPVVLNIPAGVVHGFTFERGMEGDVITLPTELTGELRLASMPSLERFAMAQPSDALVTIVRSLRHEHAGTARHRAIMLAHWAGLLLGEVANALHDVDSSLSVAREDTRLIAFDSLVEAKFAQRWRIEAYAQSLAMTPTHLNRLCRRHRGLSASQIVGAREEREARRLLAYTVLPIEAVAFRLGFRDPAHFSRRFRLMSGMSPRQYRAQMNEPSS